MFGNKNTVLSSNPIITDNIEMEKFRNTIAKRILSNAPKCPQKVVIVDCDGARETTWAQLLEAATKIASKGV